MHGVELRAKCSTDRALCRDVLPVLSPQSSASPRHPLPSHLALRAPRPQVAFIFRTPQRAAATRGHILCSI